MMTEMEEQDRQIEIAEKRVLKYKRELNAAVAELERQKRILAQMKREKRMAETQPVLTAFAAVNDPQEAKLFFEEYDIPYKEITRGENKGKLRVRPIRAKEYELRRETERKLRRSHLEIVIDHPNVFRDRKGNAVVTFSPYDIDELPKNRPWLEMSDHSIYGNGTKTFVVRCMVEE